MIGVSDANSTGRPGPRELSDNLSDNSGCIASQPANVVALRPERR